MKRATILILTVLSLVSVPAVMACDHDGEKGKMGDKMMMPHGMMGGKSIVSSNDGGVIVLSGNTLYKYDKNLNLVKQVDLPGGPGVMCPVCHMIHKDGKICPMAGKKDKEKEGAEKASDTGPEHEAHHPEK